MSIDYDLDYIVLSMDDKPVSPDTGNTPDGGGAGSSYTGSGEDDNDNNDQNVSSTNVESEENLDNHDENRGPFDNINLEKAEELLDWMYSVKDGYERFEYKNVAEEIIKDIDVDLNGHEEEFLKCGEKAYASLEKSATTGEILNYNNDLVLDTEDKYVHTHEGRVVDHLESFIHELGDDLQEYGGNVDLAKRNQEPYENTLNNETINETTSYNNAQNSNPAEDNSTGNKRSR